MFDAVGLTSDADLNNLGYVIGFNARLQFQFSDYWCRKKVIIFGVSHSSSAHADNKFVYACITLKLPAFLYANGIWIYHLKANQSKINSCSLCLVNISKVLLLDNMRKTVVKKKHLWFFVDYNTIDVIDILDIHIYLMKKLTWYKCLKLLRKYLICY